MANKSKTNCYCAFCKSTKRVAKHKNIRLPQFFACVVLAVVLTYLIFQKPDLKGLFFLIVLLVASELFYVLRWRSSVICSSCGFDPVLYRKDPSRAALQVKFQLEKRERDPVVMLRRPLHLPKISKARKLQIENGILSPIDPSLPTSSKGIIVSKSV